MVEVTLDLLNDAEIATNHLCTRRTLLAVLSRKV